MRHETHSNLWWHIYLSGWPNKVLSISNDTRMRAIIRKKQKKGLIYQSSLISEACLPNSEMFSELLEKDAKSFCLRLFNLLTGSLLSQLNGSLNFVFIWLLLSSCEVWFSKMRNWCKLSFIFIALLKDSANLALARDC